LEDTWVDHIAATLIVRKINLVFSQHVFIGRAASHSPRSVGAPKLS